jgi:hypothetical protein
MARSKGVGTGVAALRLAATDVAAGGAQPEIEATAAFLAAARQGFRETVGDVLAGLGRW